MAISKWQLIWSFVKDHKWVLAGTLVTGLIFNIFTLLIPVAIGKFYELNFSLSSKKLRIIESFGILDDISFLNFLYFFIALVWLRFVFEYLNRYLIGFMGERFSKELRERLFAHQLHVAYPIYEEKGIGKYLLRFSGDLKGVQNYLTRGLLRFTQDIILIIILLGIIVMISPMFALVILVFGMITMLLLGYLNKILFTVSEQRRNMRSGILSFVNTRLRAVLSIKAYNKYTPEIKRYTKRSRSIFDIGLRYQKIISLIYALVPMITYLLIALLMAMVFYYYHGESTLVEPSVLLILILIIISILPVLRRVLRISVVWKLGNISFAKLINILLLERENLAADSTGLISGIEFKDVSFAYAQDCEPVLNHVDITLNGVGGYVLIGEPGSGKTTFMKILLAIYQPTGGSVAYVNMEDQQPGELAVRRNIAVVADILPLYGRDVYEAIVYSRNNERRQRAEKLLKELQQHEPPSLKLSLDDKIGELAGNLTAGQQKILMYARALLTNKPILILENPFTNLSGATALNLQKKVTALATKKLIIILNNAPLSKMADFKVFKFQHQQIIAFDQQA